MEENVNGVLLVTEIVNNDYRTAAIFQKYSIDYCCGGKRPLETACALMGVDAGLVIKELEEVKRDLRISNPLLLQQWDIHFLTAYIVNVHHLYLKNTIPAVKLLLDEFVKGHEKQFVYLGEMQQTFHQLADLLLPLMKQEEEVIFPYIRQLSHAYLDKEPYAHLLIRGLRKRVKEAISQEHLTVTDKLLSLQKITGGFVTPANVCTKHKVVIAKLKELDNDINQHFYLENEILFPRLLQLEYELLQQPGNVNAL